MDKILLSVVIPIYKNELNLPVTIPTIMSAIPVVFEGYDVELILVNDGSPDNSWTIMEEFQKKHPETIKIIKLTRNFGQGMAVLCGFEQAKGVAIGVISADLQDPFELFGDMVKKWEEGGKLICGVRETRKERGISTVFSKTTHYLISTFLNHNYPKGGFDFFFADRILIEQYCKLQEANGSGQLNLLWFGYPTVFLPYERKERELGTSAWTFSKKVKMFVDIFISNSYLPLRIMSSFGVLCAGISFLYAIYIVLSTIFTESIDPVLGWPSLAVLIIFFGGLTLVSLGIVGEYLWRILEKTGKKPLYVVEKSEGFTTTNLSENNKNTD